MVVVRCPRAFSMAIGRPAGSFGGRRVAVAVGRAGLAAHAVVIERRQAPQRIGGGLEQPAGEVRLGRPDGGGQCVSRPVARRLRCGGDIVSAGDGGRCRPSEAEFFSSVQRLGDRAAGGVRKVWMVGVFMAATDSFSWSNRNILLAHPIHGFERGVRGRRS